MEGLSTECRQDESDRCFRLLQYTCLLSNCWFARGRPLKHRYRVKCPPYQWCLKFVLKFLKALFFSEYKMLLAYSVLWRNSSAFWTWCGVFFVWVLADNHTIFDALRVYPWFASISTNVYFIFRNHLFYYVTKWSARVFMIPRIKSFLFFV